MKTVASAPSAHLHSGPDSVDLAAGVGKGEPRADGRGASYLREDYVLTRSIVGRMLGVSYATVRMYEGKLLHPILRRGVHYFSAREVEEARNARHPNAGPTLKRYLEDGDLVARIVEHLEEKRPIREIVVLERVPFTVVREVYAEWRTPLGGAVFSPERLRQDEEHRQRLREAQEKQIDKQIELLARTSAGRGARRPEKPSGGRASARSSPATSEPPPPPSSPPTASGE